MLSFLRKVAPRPVVKVYHYALAVVSAFWYGRPSDKLIVIGVTGTNGKSSTVQFIAQLLELLGESVGYTTTAGFMIAGKSIENKMKMTMPGRFLLQNLMSQMVKSGCRYAVIETSSQGIEQFRHLGINYDVAVFTNLTPEHIESHGSFEAYKAAKGKLFNHLGTSRHKKIDGEVIPKVSVINAYDHHADFFAAFPADRLIRFSAKNEGELEIPFEADFQRKNVVAAVAVIEALGFPREDIQAAVKKLQPIAGRFEKVELGQPFTVIIDYAYEPYALKALFESVAKLNPKRVLGVHGSAGGGRDVARRVEIGKMAAEHEAIVIVTNEDPYDEDPRMIIEEVARGAREAGKIDDESLFLIDDRQAAINLAMKLAQPGDVVVLTGKGSEPVIAGPNGTKLPWSERAAAEMAIKEAVL